jgi:hypothetical protein
MIGAVASLQYRATSPVTLTLSDYLQISLRGWCMERFAQPDDMGPITASDLCRYNWLRIVTDAHSLIAPALFLVGALLIFLAVRFVFAGSVMRLRVLITLWAEAKERELRARGQTK